MFAYAPGTTGCSLDGCRHRKSQNDKQKKKKNTKAPRGDKTVWESNSHDSYYTTR